MFVPQDLLSGQPRFFLLVRNFPNSLDPSKKRGQKRILNPNRLLKKWRLIKATFYFCLLWRLDLFEFLFEETNAIIKGVHWKSPALRAGLTTNKCVSLVKTGLSMLALTWSTKDIVATKTYKYGLQHDLYKHARKPWYVPSVGHTNFKLWCLG